MITDESTYNTVCETIINDENINKQENRNLWIKRLNILVSLFNEPNGNKRIEKLCKNFNTWLYYQIKPFMFTDELVREFFGKLKKIPGQSANVNVSLLWI